MEFSPPRARGVLLGAALLIGCLVLGAAGVAGLIRSGLSPALPVWAGLSAAGLGAAAWTGYRLWGLLTSRYRLDREGFSLRWGMCEDHVPLAELTGVQLAVEVPEVTGLRGSGWPGNRSGTVRAAGVGRVEIFAGSGEPVVVSAGDRHWLVTPGDAQAFLQAFRDASRLGSLQPTAGFSRRPEFVALRMWSDRGARALLFAGFVVPVALLGFLSISEPGLPSQVPFGFTPDGAPAPAAPLPRLALLPGGALALWLVDLVFGSWLYRHEEERPLAYGLWAVPVAVGGLVWGATLLLLAAA